MNFDDIVHLESLGDYVIAYTTNKKIVTKERISNLAAKLPADKFLQIHRSYIVSISKIESVGPGFIEINGKKLPVGRSFKNEVNALLGSK